MRTPPASHSCSHPVIVVKLYAQVALYMNAEEAPLLASLGDSLVFWQSSCYG